LLAELVAALPAAGFRGVNVTNPHKQAVLALANELTPRARAIGAANTLWFGGGPAIAADNTDAPALLHSLPVPVAGATALVLGAGGSARAAVWALLDAGAREVRVLNRTAERARELCDQLGGSVVRRAEPADVLVNCTAVGLDGGSPFGRLPIVAGDLPRYGCVVDFVYRGAGTELVRTARECGVPAVDGLELLVGQGAISFERFTGRPAPLATMRRAVGLGDSDYGEAR
jgi:shikimate dehydrogenase